MFAPSQWEMALHCNAISHWLSAYTEWFPLVVWPQYKKTFVLMKPGHARASLIIYAKGPNNKFMGILPYGNKIVSSTMKLYIISQQHMGVIIPVLRCWYFVWFQKTFDNWSYQYHIKFQNTFDAWLIWLYCAFQQTFTKLQCRTCKYTLEPPYKMVYQNHILL